MSTNKKCSIGLRIVTSMEQCRAQNEAHKYVFEQMVFHKDDKVFEQEKMSATNDAETNERHMQK